MRKPLHRLLLALIASVLFNALAYAAGLAELFLFPVRLMFLSLSPNNEHSVATDLIMIFSPLLAYAVVFWAVATICSMLIELLGEHR